jgi:hypothetical protein
VAQRFSAAIPRIYGWLKAIPRPDAASDHQISGQRTRPSTLILLSKTL